METINMIWGVQKAANRYLAIKMWYESDSVDNIGLYSANRVEIEGYMSPYSIPKIEKSCSLFWFVAIIDTIPLDAWRGFCNFTPNLLFTNK